jgi:hypothetical protein
MIREYYRPLFESEKIILERQIAEVKSGIPKTIAKTVLLSLLIIGFVIVVIFFPKPWVLISLFIIAFFIFLNFYYLISDLLRLPGFLTQKQQVAENGIVQVTEINIDRYIKIDNYSDEGDYFVIEYEGMLSLVGGQDFLGIRNLKNKIEQIVIMNSEKTGSYYDTVKKSGKAIEPYYIFKSPLPDTLVKSEMWTNLTDRGPFPGKLEDLTIYMQEDKGN